MNSVRRYPPLRAVRLGDQAVGRALRDKRALRAGRGRDRWLVRIVRVVVGIVLFVTHPLRMASIYGYRSARGLCTHCGGHPRVVCGSHQYCDSCRRMVAK